MFFKQLLVASGAIALSTLASAQTFDACGTMLDNPNGGPSNTTSCRMFVEDGTGLIYQVQGGPQGFNDGDRVRTTGDINLIFGTFCWGPITGGMIENATLTADPTCNPPSFDACGTMLDNPNGGPSSTTSCRMFVEDGTGLIYQVEGGPQGFNHGDRVRATGDVTLIFGTVCWGPITGGMIQNATLSADPTCDPVNPIVIGCDPAANHYLGNYVKLNDSGFGSGTGSDLHLDAKDGPAGEFGFFLMSTDGSASAAVFNGILCLGSPTGRYNTQIATNQGLPQLSSIGQFDALGNLQNLSGTSLTGSGFDVPTELPFSPAGQTIMPGDTLFFQCWYRDQVAPLPNPGSSANFSNMVEVTFP